jgi:transposase
MTRIKYQEAAGLIVRRGRPPAGQTPSKADLVRLYVQEGQSVRDVAAALGCSKDMVHRRLKEFGIKVRPPAKRSRLRKLDQGKLFAAIAEKGIDRTAADWNIPMRTLTEYLARLRKGTS